MKMKTYITFVFLLSALSANGIEYSVHKLPPTAYIHIDECYDLNDLGHVVGVTSRPGINEWISFRYVDGKYHYYSAPGFQYTTQYAINNFGQSVGWVESPDT
jgi:hypothetical protein